MKALQVAVVWRFSALKLLVYWSQTNKGNVAGGGGGGITRNELNVRSSSAGLIKLNLTQQSRSRYCLKHAAILYSWIRFMVEGTIAIECW